MHACLICTNHCYSYSFAFSWWQYKCVISDETHLKHILLIIYMCWVFYLCFISISDMDQIRYLLVIMFKPHIYPPIYIYVYVSVRFRFYIISILIIWCRHSYFIVTLLIVLFYVLFRMIYNFYINIDTMCRLLTHIVS